MECLTMQKLGHSEVLRRSDLSVRQAEAQGGFKSRSAIDQIPNVFDLGSAKSPNLTPNTKAKMSRPNSLRNILSDVPQDIEEKKIILSKPKKQKIRWRNISMKW